MGNVKGNRTAKQVREARLVVVSELYKKGYGYDAMRQMVMQRLGLDTYSKSTLHKDIHILLTEWRSTRIENTDLSVQLELEKINAQEVELWEAWDKSKENIKLTSKKQKGVASKTKSVGPGGSLTDTDKISTTEIERTEKDEINFGDARYQAELTKLGQERRKLLGLYAPEKKELSGELGFYGFLQQNNVLED